MPTVIIPDITKGTLKLIVAIAPPTFLVIKSGSIGITIPKPIKSIKTTRRSTSVFLSITTYFTTIQLSNLLIAPLLFTKSLSVLIASSLVLKSFIP